MLVLLDRHAGVPEVGRDLDYDVPAFHVSRQQPLEEGRKEERGLDEYTSMSCISRGRSAQSCELAGSGSIGKVRYGSLAENQSAS